jgi:hypothetical protein
MPPKTQRTLLEDEQKRVKANADRLSGNNQAPGLSAPSQVIEDRMSGASPEFKQKVRRNLLDAAGGPQSDENWHVVPGSSGFSMRSKHFDPATKALFAPKSVQEAIDPRGRTEILQAGDIDFSQNRGGGVLKTGVSAEDALAVLRGNKPPQPDFAVRGTGIPALPDNIAQRRSDFAEESAAAIRGGSREDRAKRLTEIRRPAVEAAAKTEADAAALLLHERKTEVEGIGPNIKARSDNEIADADRLSKSDDARLDRESTEREGAAGRTSNEAISKADRKSNETISAGDVAGRANVEKIRTDGALTLQQQTTDNSIAELRAQGADFTITDGKLPPETQRKLRETRLSKAMEIQNEAASSRDETLIADAASNLQEARVEFIRGVMGGNIISPEDLAKARDQINLMQEESGALEAEQPITEETAAMFDDDGNGRLDDFEKSQRDTYDRAVIAVKSLKAAGKTAAAEAATLQFITPYKKKLKERFGSGAGTGSL